MNAKSGLAVLMGVVGAAAALAIAFRPKSAQAATPSQSSGDLGAGNDDLAEVVQATNGNQIVVADDVTGQVVVPGPAPAIPESELIDDVQAAKGLSDLVEAEPGVSEEEAIQEVLPEVDEDAEIAAEVAAPAPVYVAPAPAPAPAPVYVAPAPAPAPAPVYVAPAPAPAPAPVYVAPAPAPAPVPVYVAPAPEPASAALLYQAYLLRAEHEPGWEDMGKDVTESFQRAYDLSVDGAAGPGTILKLVSETKTGPVPIVRKWPKNTWINDAKYRAYIEAIRKLGLDPSREKGQALTNSPITDLRTL
jgi:hypothetical protein